MNTDTYYFPLTDHVVGIGMTTTRPGHQNTDSKGRLQKNQKYAKKAEPGQHVRRQRNDDAGSPVADKVRVLELVVEVYLLAVDRQESRADGVFVVAARFSSELRRWRARSKRRVLVELLPRVSAYVANEAGPR